MSNIAIKGATTGTGTFTIESPATNTDRTLTLPDEAGTVLTSASDIIPNATPAFQAYMSNIDPSVTGSTWTKVAFDTERFDTHGYYNNSTYRFTPLIEGYYLIEGHAQWNNSATATTASIWKNGAEFMRCNDNASSSTAHVNYRGLVYMNGSTDYVELYIYGGTTQNLDGRDSGVTAWFSGILLREA